MILVEYACPHHDRFEYLESLEAQDSRPCPICETDSPWCISAPAIKPNYGSVTQGKSSEPPPGAIDTRPLADGMPTSEWRAKQSAARKDKIRAHVKKALG